MRRFFTLVAVLVAVSSVAFGAPRSGSGKGTGVEQALMQLEREWFDAYVKKDTATLDRIEADDFAVTDPSGMVSTKAQDIDGVKSGKLVFESGTFDDMKVRVYGAAAVVTARVTLKGTYIGQDISGAYRGIDVFVKRNGRWQVVASQVTRITETA